MPQEYPRYEQEPTIPLIDQWGMRQLMNRNGVLENFLSDIAPQSHDLFTLPELIKAVNNHIVAKLQSLNTALQQMGWSERIAATDSASIERCGMALARLAVRLLSHEAEIARHDERSDTEKIDRVLYVVEDSYGLCDFTSIVGDARITGKSPLVGEASPARFSPQSVEDSELEDALRNAAQKKILLDLYVQGKPLNQLGHLYAYYCERDWTASAPYRALADCLQLVGAVQMLMLARAGMSLSGVAGGAGDADNNIAARLGHMEIRDIQGEYKIIADGMTAAELMHELSKGLLEYIVLDTSLPAHGDFIPKAAEQLRRYLHRPTVEFVEYLYGPPLAKTLDFSLLSWLDHVRALPSLQQEPILCDLADTLRVSKSNILDKDNDSNLLLRLFKVISMMDGNQIKNVYTAALNNSAPHQFEKHLKRARATYDEQIS